MEMYIERSRELGRKLLSIDDEVMNKEISLSTKSGEYIEGVIRETREGGIVLSESRNWEVKKSIEIENVSEFELSKHPYFSLGYYRELRVKKKTRPEYRYKRDELRSLLGKYAFVNSDGNIVDGEISDIQYKEYNSKLRYSLVIRTIADDVLETVEDYTIRELEVTGDSLKHHLKAQAVRAIEAEIYLEMDRMSLLTYEELDLDSTTQNPLFLLEEYFDDRIKGLKGDDFNLKKFNFSWTQEALRDNINNRENIERELDKGRAINEYYEKRLKLIDKIFERIARENWKKYGVSQSEGETRALEYIRNSGAVF